MNRVAGTFVAVAALAVIAVWLTGIYSDRCTAIGGEWHVIRGCKVVNLHGETQWVTRP